MDLETPDRERTKIAAALAAVEVFLRDEASAASARQRAVPAISPAASAWALAGRLAAMNARLPGGPRGRG